MYTIHTSPLSTQDPSAHKTPQHTSPLGTQAPSAHKPPQHTSPFILAGIPRQHPTYAHLDFRVLAIEPAAIKGRRAGGAALPRVLAIEPAAPPCRRRSCRDRPCALRPCPPSRQTGPQQARPRLNQTLLRLPLVSYSCPAQPTRALTMGIIITDSTH